MQVPVGNGRYESGPHRQPAPDMVTWRLGWVTRAWALPPGTGKAISRVRRWRELPVAANCETDRSLRVVGMPGGIGSGLLGCVGAEADSDGLVVAALCSVDDVC